MATCAWFDGLTHVGGRIHRNVAWRWRRVHKAVLRRLAVRRLRREASLIGVTGKPAIVFAPHQDDETLGCGGLIAAKCRLGTPLTVVFLTDGAACLLEAVTPAERAEISAVRRREAISALATLGMQAEDVVFLDLPDGELTALREPERRAVVARLQALIERLAPQEIFLPFRNDFHPDHQVTQELVRTAAAEARCTAELWHYFVWSLWESACLGALSEHERAELHHIALPPEQQSLKRAAIGEYRSQYEHDMQRQRFVFPDGFVRFLTSPYEFFLREAISTGCNTADGVDTPQDGRLGLDQVGS